MTATNPRIRTLRRASMAGLVAFLALAGCKSKDGGNAVGSRDPLLPNRIPPQNVPLPERGGIGVKGKNDPLLGAPTGKSGVGYNDDPERFKGIFTPGEGSTPAAMAGKLKDSGELKIDTPDNRVPLQPAGGVVPAPSTDAGAGETAAGVDGLYKELEKYGVKREGRVLDRRDGKYTFRASIPWEGGTLRWYHGEGDTATAAVKQVLDSIAADRK